MEDSTKNLAAATSEKNPTASFQLYIIHPDRQGGGVFRILKAEGLTRLFSPQAVDVRNSHESDLKVPPEVFKGRNTARGKLLDVHAAIGRAYVRCESDILHDPRSADANANVAIQELKDRLKDPAGLGEHVPGFVFKENTILLMNNARYLHSRINIRDPRCWLRRLRFHGTTWAVKESEEAMGPWMDGVSLVSVSAAAPPQS